MPVAGRVVFFFFVLSKDPPHGDRHLYQPLTSAGPPLSLAHQATWIMTCPTPLRSLTLQPEVAGSPASGSPLILGPSPIRKRRHNSSSSGSSSSTVKVASRSTPGVQTFPDKTRGIKKSKGRSWLTGLTNSYVESRLVRRTKGPLLDGPSKPAAQTFPDKNHDKKSRKKKRSRLTGLTKSFYIESRHVRRGPLFGGPSGTEQHSQVISASDTRTPPCDSEVCYLWTFYVDSDCFPRVKRNSSNRHYNRIPVCLRLFQTRQRSYARSTS